jgi:hypothetical protein
VLRDCYSYDRGIADGAILWAEAIASYTEACFPGLDGVSIRIIARGRLPEGVKLPTRIEVLTSGFCPITGMRISPYPTSYRLDDTEGRIRDATDALAHLCREPRPSYVGI